MTTEQNKQSEYFMDKRVLANGHAFVLVGWVLMYRTPWKIISLFQTNNEIVKIRIFHILGDTSQADRNYNKQNLIFLF